MMYENTPKKITTFTDLYAWQEGHKLVLLVYSLTKNFPKEELFVLVSQIRRAVVSITSNIAEGFSRATPKDKCQFYSIAQGSLTELQNQLIISKDLKYISNKDFIKFSQQSIVVHKLITGLKKIKNTYP